MGIRFGNERNTEESNRAAVTKRHRVRGIRPELTRVLTKKILRFLQTRASLGLSMNYVNSPRERIENIRRVTVNPVSILKLQPNSIHIRGLEDSA